MKMAWFETPRFPRNGSFRARASRAVTWTVEGDYRAALHCAHSRSVAVRTWWWSRCACARSGRDVKSFCSFAITAYPAARTRPSSVLVRADHLCRCSSWGSRTVSRRQPCQVYRSTSRLASVTKSAPAIKYDLLSTASRYERAFPANKLIRLYIERDAPLSCRLTISEGRLCIFKWGENYKSEQIH